MNNQAIGQKRTLQATGSSTQPEAGARRLFSEKRYDEIVSNQAWNHSALGVGYNSAQETYRHALTAGNALGKPGQLVAAVIATPIALLRLFYSSIQAYFRNPDQVERDKLEGIADELESDFRTQGRNTDFDLDAFEALMDNIRKHEENFTRSGMGHCYSRVLDAANAILMSKLREAMMKTKAAS